jgi:hypothetical protein
VKYCGRAWMKTWKVRKTGRTKKKKKKEKRSGLVMAMMEQCDLY